MLFRIRFRVPYPILEKLVKITRDNSWFLEGPHCTDRPYVPLETEVIAVLGRGYCFDGVEELCLISVEEISQNLSTYQI